MPTPSRIPKLETIRQALSTPDRATCRPYPSRRDGFMAVDRKKSLLRASPDMCDSRMSPYDRQLRFTPSIFSRLELLVPMVYRTRCRNNRSSNGHHDVPVAPACRTLLTPELQ